MDHSTKRFVLMLCISALVRGEPPVGSDGVSVVSDIDSNPTPGSYGGTSSYSSYAQPGPPSSSYTAAIPAARPVYQAPRPTYGTAYLPVIPVSASLYSFSTSPTSEYGTYGTKSSIYPAYGNYGTSQPWLGSSPSWASVSSNPWASVPWNTGSTSWQSSSQPWASTSQPWASSSQPWLGSSQPWASSSQPWASSSQSWAGVSGFSPFISLRKQDNENIIGIKPPSE